VAFLADAFDFPAGARMTGISDPGRDVGGLPGGLVTAHRVVVPDDQHSVTEERFTLAHLPLAVVGFHGVDPDGSGWFVTFQAAGTTAGRSQYGEPADVVRLLNAGFRRALSLNPRAILLEEFALTVDDILEAYADAGVAPDELATWTAADLVRGLIAELCGASLSLLARGYPAGCAYADMRHECAGDVFSDVFGEWAAGRYLAPGGLGG
jgi:hypothetical protein